MDKIQSSFKSIGATVSPFAARTQQFVKEQLGQADEKTELPADYRELEKRVDALAKVHTRLLSVTSQYANEAYDYPPNLRESITDLSRNISEKVQLLSAASTPAEAQSALTAPSHNPPQPKTFPHAISRAAVASARLLPADDPLSRALDRYGSTMEVVGNFRLEQDKLIQSEFNAEYNTTLNNAFKFAEKSRREVENARLLLDAAKARQRNREHGGGQGPASFFTPKKDPAAEAVADEGLRVEIEHLEDDFVNATEKAVGIMKNVLDTPEPLRSLLLLIKRQQEFHQSAATELGEVYSSIEQLQN